MSKTAARAELRRDRVVVIAALAGITILAWLYVASLAVQMGAENAPPLGSDGAMAGMNMTGMTMPDMPGVGSASGAIVEPGFRQWSIVDFIVMFIMWTVMMVGMMTPSVTPMVLLYAAVGRDATAKGRPLAATSWFFAGYLSVWILFSLAATAMQWTLTQFALLTPMMGSTSGVFGGMILLVAGLYQWSQLKSMCLSQCQSPLGFLMSHGGFRSELYSTLRLGAEHGLYCVGCCWVLMLLLFVGGVMNVLWIAGLAILVLVEKLAPASRLISRVAGSIMVAAGLVLLFRAI